jgi:hypothetical protein
LPYQPPFDFELPNYEKVGKSLWNLAHSCPADDTPLPKHEPDVSDLKSNWDLLPTLKNLSDDVDDPFYRAKAPLPRKTTTKASAARPTSESKTTRNVVGRTVSSSTSIKSSTSATTTTATTTATTTKVGMSRPAASSSAVGRPVTRSVSAKAGTMKVAEVPRRPATVAAVTSLSRPLKASGITCKPRAASTTVTKQLKTSSCENVKASGGRGPIGSNPLKGIKEEQGDSAGGIIPASMLEIADEFLFEV